MQSTQTQPTQTELVALEIHRDFWLWDEGDAPRCPFCEERLSDCDDDASLVYCPNYTDCTYATSSTIREVVAALVAQGRDMLSACELAAKYSAEQDDPLNPVTPDQFEVTDHASLNWAMRKIAEARRTHDRVQAGCDAEIRRLEEQRDRVMLPLRRHIEFLETTFGWSIEEFVRKEIAGTKKRSIESLYGPAGYRKNPDSLNILDENAAIGMGESLPELAGVVRVVKSISKTTAKRVLAELPEGHPFRTAVEIKPGEDVFYIRAESLEA